MATILQFSDPHLMSHANGTLKGVPTATNLQQVLSCARQKFPRPTRLVLTGDLSHEHTADGYQLLRELLGDWSDQCLLVPGNHDDRGVLREVFARQVPGNADEPVWFHHRVREAGSPEATPDDWLLIGLDSQIPGEASGEIGEELLDRLRDWLSADPARPTLIFLHHPPTCVGSWVDAIGLRDAEQLESVVRQSTGLRGIFFGHIHQEFQGDLAGVPCFSAPSTAFQFVPGIDQMEFDQKPPGFRVIELRESQFTTRVVRLSDATWTPADCCHT